MGRSPSCHCHCYPCPITVNYPQGSVLLESNFYYALNTPSNQTFYNPVTTLTMLYTDTPVNLGPLDEVGVILLQPSSFCTWTGLRYGTAELEAFILRGHTIGVVIEGTPCFDTAEKTIVDGWLSSLGGADISIVRANVANGCQTVTNIAAANNLNTGLATWSTDGSSYFTVAASAKAIVTASHTADGVPFGGDRIIVAGTVSTLAGNTLNGKVLAFGDENTFTNCLFGTGLQDLYDNICDAFGDTIT